MTDCAKCSKLSKLLSEARNKLLYLDQLRPLVKTGREGYMKKISFEQMSEYASKWMEQEGIE